MLMHDVSVRVVTTEEIALKVIFAVAEANE